MLKWWAAEPCSNTSFSRLEASFRRAVASIRSDRGAFSFGFLARSTRCPNDQSSDICYGISTYTAAQPFLSLLQSQCSLDAPSFCAQACIVGVPAHAIQRHIVPVNGAATRPRFSHHTCRTRTGSPMRTTRNPRSAHASMSSSTATVEGVAVVKACSVAQPKHTIG